MARRDERSPKAPVPRLALNVTDAAAALGVSADYFTAHISGELRWVRKGSKKLLPVTELQRWLEANASSTLEADRR